MPDTLSYDDTEMYVELEPDAALVMLTRAKGNANAGFVFYFWPN